MWISRHRWPLSLAAVTVAALALRLVNIGTEPYWADEVLSLDIVLHFDRVAAMVEYVGSVEFHPPLYYLLLKPWIAWFGAGEAAVRSLSLVFSVACVPLIAAFSRRMFRSDVAALGAAALMAVLPMAVEFGQEARPYAAMLFAALTASWAAWEWASSGRHRFGAAYAASLALGMYLHYSFAFFAMSLALWTLWRVVAGGRAEFGRGLVAWLCAHGAAFLAFYPWAVPLLYKMDFGRFTVLEYERNTTPLRPSWYGNAVLEQLVWASKARLLSNAEVAAKLLAMFAAVWASVKAIAEPKSGERSEPSRALGFLGFIFCLPILLFLLSPTSRPYTPLYARHVIYALVPMTLAAGYALSRMPPKRAAALAGLFVASMTPALIGVLGDDSSWDPNHRVKLQAEYVNEQYREGDIVISWGAFMRTDINHYLRPELSAISYLPVTMYGHEGDPWSSRATLGLLENESQVRHRIATDAQGEQKIARIVRDRSPKRIWLLYFPTDDVAVHRWLRARGWRQAFQSAGDLFSVDMFVAPAAQDSDTAAKKTP